LKKFFTETGFADYKITFSKIIDKLAAILSILVLLCNGWESV